MELETSYAGLKLKNPVIVASATPTINLDGLKKSADCGAGAMIAKSIIYSKPYAPGVPHIAGRRTGCNTSPRFKVFNKDIEFDRGLYARGGLYTMLNLLEPYPTPEEWAPVMEKIKKYTDVPVILSLCAEEKNYEEWQSLAKMLENMGADAIEVSMHHMPYATCTDPLLIKAIKEVVKTVPVVAKPMFPNEDPLVIGPALVKNGADGITAIGNTNVKGFEVNIDTEDFVFQPTSYSVRGPWLRPIGLHWILMLARCTDVSLSGVTGVANYRDVVKYIMSGASTVQVCTALYVEGFAVITKMIRGLEKWMHEHDYNSIEEFRGKLVKRWMPSTELPYDASQLATITPNCTGCGFCTSVCFFHAITLADNTAVVDAHKCDGCGLCYSICPFRAIFMQNIQPFYRE